jgi:hypothetical protein
MKTCTRKKGTLPVLGHSICLPGRKILSLTGNISRSGTAGVSHRVFGLTLAVASAFVLLCVCSAFAATVAPSKKQSASEVKNRPLIQVKELEYNFGEILEGVEPEHEFTIKNIGTADLDISNVRVDCGCTAVKYDPTIPPHGEGKVRMKVSLKNYVGKVDKKATIQSNDPQTPEVIVRMLGTVLPIIDIKPSTGVLFRGMADQLPESVLEMTASTAPFHITGTETNLADNISYTLETVTEGNHYRLRVSNKLKQGSYGGFIKLDTDLAIKPDIVIRVSGFIEGEISVKPQNVLIGRLSANQPERLANVAVTSNRSKPFDITRLTYDESLMSVSKEASEDQTSFILVVSPKLEGVPVGARKQSTLKIETDLNPNEKVEVTVHLFNSADQPEAQHK